MITSNKHINHQPKLKKQIEEIEWIDFLGERFSPILMEEMIQTTFGIRNVCVVEHDLDICVVLEESSSISLKDIRKVLIQKFDAYICPTKLYRIDTFVYTEEEKLDRKFIKNKLSQSKPIENEMTQLNTMDETSQQVIHLIQKVLPDTSFELEDNFIEIGGDSLKAAELNALLMDRFNISLEPQHFFGSSNLQNIIDTIKNKTQSSYCVKLNQVNSDKTPLFFIHDLSLDILSYFHIANLFTDRSVYGIKLLKNEFSQSEFTLESLSKCYLNEIKKITQGPIYLAGLSIGGLIAYEMSNQSENVTYCLMIDTKKVVKEKNRNRMDYFIKGIKNGLYSLKGLSIKEKMIKVQEKTLPFLSHTLKQNQNGLSELNFKHAVKKYECKKTNKRIDYFVALDEKDTISFEYYKQFIPNIVRYEAHCLHSAFVKGLYNKQSVEWMNQRFNEIEKEIESYE